MNSSTEAADDWTLPAQGSGASTFIQANALLLVYGLLCGLSLIPFLAIAQPPIVDFANHAARLTMACHQHDPAIAAMYRYRFDIIPNLTIDAVNLPLCGVVTPTRVLQLVTAGSLSLIYLSGWIIQRKLFGRANVFVLLLPAIAFNLVTTMGYINFLAGVALACLMIAFAIGRQHRFTSLLLLCNLGGLVLFFCHIFALGFVMLIFFGLMLGESSITWKRIFNAGMRTILLFALPLALVAFVPAGGDGLIIGYDDKLRELPPLIMGRHASPRIWGLALSCALYLALKRKVICLHRDLQVPLAIGVLFVILAPNRIQDGFDIDVRLAVPLAYLCFAALQPLRNYRRSNAVVTLVAAVLTGSQLWALASIWEPFSGQVDEFRAATAILPAHARVLPVFNADGPRLTAGSSAYVHLTSYAVIDRRIFNPLEFTGAGMQPLSVTPAYAAISPGVGAILDRDTTNRLARPDAVTEKAARKSPMIRVTQNWPRKFDYVIFYHFGGTPNFNPALLQEVHRGSFFSILKVKKVD